MTDQTPIANHGGETKAGAQNLKLTRTQRERLANMSDDWVEQPSGWKAGKVFLDLLEMDLVEWRLKPRSDVSSGPGYNGSDWCVRRTPKGLAAVQAEAA